VNQTHIGVEETCKCSR